MEKERRTKKESMKKLLIKIQKETTIAKIELLFPLVLFFFPKLIINHITNFYCQPISGQDTSKRTSVRRNESTMLILQSAT